MLPKKILGDGSSDLSHQLQNPISVASHHGLLS